MKHDIKGGMVEIGDIILKWNRTYSVLANNSIAEILKRCDMQ